MNARSNLNHNDIELWRDSNGPLGDNIAQIENDVLLEFNASLILVPCSCKLYLPHCRTCTKQTVSREKPPRSTYTVLCAMRAAQQQAVAWFTLSRGVLVHATLTSTQLKSVAHTTQSVESEFNRIEGNILFW